MNSRENPPSWALPVSCRTALNLIGFRTPFRIPEPPGPEAWHSAGAVDGGPSFVTDAAGEWTIAVTGPKGASAAAREAFVARLVDCLNAGERRR